MSKVIWKTIGDICDNVIVPMRDRPKVFDGNIPWCRIEDIEGMYFNNSLSGLKVSESVIKAMNLKVFPTGTVICSCSATLGVCAINTQPLITNQTFIGLVCSEQVNNRYLYYYMCTRKKELLSLSTTGTIPYVSREKFENMHLPVPSLSEQCRIVGILDTFTSSIENLKQQIAERRKQYEYYRDQLLDLEGKEGVEMRKLGSFAEIGTGSSNTQDELESGKYPFFVRSQIVRWKNEYEFNETAIITSGDGVGVGKVLHYYEGKYALHQRAYRIKVNVDDVIPKYLFYFMQKDFYSYIMLNAYAASVTSVRKPMLVNYFIPLPPLDEQSRIVSILDKFEKSIQNLEAHLELREKQYEFYRNKLLTFE